MNIQQNNSVNLGDFLASGSLPIRTDLAISCRMDEAISFLQELDPSGWHNLTALDPSENVAPRGRTFAPNQWGAIKEWIAEHASLGMNLYYSVNEPKAHAAHKKLEKGDIGSIRAIIWDIDLPGRNGDADLAALRNDLNLKFHAALPPTMLVESGGGYQPIWKLKDKLLLSDDKEQRDAQRLMVEAQGRGVREMFGGDSVHDINRILRLPGTLNVPNASKRARGRISRNAALVPQDVFPVYSLATLADHILPSEKSAKEHGADQDEYVRAARTIIEETELAYGFDNLPHALQDRFKSAYSAPPRLASLWAGDESALLGSDASGSGWRRSLVKMLARDRTHDFGAGEYAQLAYAWPILAEKANHPLQEMDDEDLFRQLARDWGREGHTETRQYVIDQWFDYDIASQQSEQLFPTAPRAANGQYFEVVSIEELEARPPAQWLIGRHIPKQSVGFLAGTPGAGKTFLAIDIGLSIAYGRPDWHGDDISSEDDGVVVYVSGEGGYALSARISAWRTRYSEKAPTDRFWLIEQPVNMTRAEDIEKLEKTLSDRLKRPIAAIFIDTLSRVIPGADENNQADMSRFIHACDKLKLRFRCAVVCIHHMNSGGAHMRGSTTLAGGADFIFTLSKFGNGKARKLECAKMKDGPDDWKDLYSFETQPTTSDQVSLVPVRISGNSQNNGGLTPSKSERIFEAIAQAANDGRPWALSKQSKQRCASLRMQEDFQMDREDAEEALQLWVNSGIIAEVMINPKKKLRGLQITQRQSHAAEANDAFN